MYAKYPLLKYLALAYKNSYKRHFNEKKFVRLENSPHTPHNLFNGSLVLTLFFHGPGQLSSKSDLFKFQTSFSIFNRLSSDFAR